MQYRRIPLSRNSTPAALDLQDLHNAAFVGGANLSNVQFVVMSRAASTSTSSSFVAHFLAMCIHAQGTVGGHLDASSSMSASCRASATGTDGGASPERGVPAEEGGMPPGWVRAPRASSMGDAEARASESGMPERLANSSISNLCRCAPHAPPAPCFLCSRVWHGTL